MEFQEKAIKLTRASLVPPDFKINNNFSGSFGE